MSAATRMRPLSRTASGNRFDRLRMLSPPGGMGIEIVSAFAGDRAMSAEEADFVGERREARGAAFFSDLLYAISHRYFAPEVSERLWESILCHKHLISEKLDRNVRVTVATLDYFSNITAEMRAPTLMAEAYVTVSVGVAVCDRSVDSPRALIEMADRALYRAKANGKNRVAVGGTAN